MKVLKNCVALRSTVRIYIPSTKDVDKHCDTSDYTNQALKLLYECFEGATSTKALGAWISQSTKLVKEEVTMCFAYCKEKDLERHIDAIYDFCLKMKKDLQQESIALEVNGVMYFV